MSRAAGPAVRLTPNSHLRALRLVVDDARARAGGRPQVASTAARSGLARSSPSVSAAGMAARSSGRRVALEEVEQRLQARVVPAGVVVAEEERDRLRARRPGRPGAGRASGHGAAPGPVPGAGARRGVRRAVRPSSVERDRQRASSRGRRGTASRALRRRARSASRTRSAPSARASCPGGLLVLPPLAVRHDDGRHVGGRGCPSWCCSRHWLTDTAEAAISAPRSGR